MSTRVAEFHIERLAFLDIEGKVLQALPTFAQDAQVLKRIFRQLLLTRTFDTRAINLQRTGKLGTYASSLGQEAIGVGIGYTMHENDVLCPAYREYGAMLQRKTTMTDILRYWGGDERGSLFQGDSPDLPICVPIATQCLHAAGVAKAFQYRQEPRVAVSVIGDGGTSQGDFYEALNVAGCWQLPAVFVVNNNGWAISVPLSKQTRCQTIAQKGIAGEVYSLQVDGNDVIAVTEAMYQALERARRGDGPTLLECITYRLCDHTTADDASRYRPADELARAREIEPIIRLRRYLQDIGALTDAEEQSLQESINEEVAAAVHAYETTPKPEGVAMFDHLYEELPDALALQYTEVLTANEEASHHG